MCFGVSSQISFGEGLDPCRCVFGYLHTFQSAKGWTIADVFWVSSQISVGEGLDHCRCVFGYLHKFQSVKGWTIADVCLGIFTNFSRRRAGPLPMLFWASSQISVGEGRGTLRLRYVLMGSGFGGLEGGV
jgi:hypothetical protein